MCQKIGAGSEKLGTLNLGSLVQGFQGVRRLASQRPRSNTNLGDFQAVVKSHNLCFVGFVYKLL